MAPHSRLCVHPARMPQCSSNDAAALMLLPSHCCIFSPLSRRNLGATAPMPPSLCSTFHAFAFHIAALTQRRPSQPGHLRHSSRAAAALARHMRPHILHIDEDYLSAILRSSTQSTTLAGGSPGVTVGGGEGFGVSDVWGGGGGVFGPEGEGSAEDLKLKILRSWREHSGRISEIDSESPFPNLVMPCHFFATGVTRSTFGCCNSKLRIGLVWSL